MPQAESVQGDPWNCLPRIKSDGSTADVTSRSLRKVAVLGQLPRVGFRKKRLTRWQGCEGISVSDFNVSRASAVFLHT